MESSSKNDHSNVVDSERFFTHATPPSKLNPTGLHGFPITGASIGKNILSVNNYYKFVRDLGCRWL
jgi:hypothetical protein